jgi:hypothetical protein
MLKPLFFRQRVEGGGEKGKKKAHKKGPQR